ncbi:6-hydroxy-D-nicotine oxidase [Pochonia chlamydosporia 170]|uniref:6-hydroxy-D-nicotine oxidase n=1 Tax=Pochonia chlamydosporia 170 TaxID=1380566 RepID=A0A179FYH5_METCM|nr:6-hydroxy-D-nicotine oxidase [Pochonia chlamydosporia 170]OAQ70726.1 6-hydroxy-D-nicotine oxidase [Pochonia chlamydosporia 170]
MRFALLLQVLLRCTVALSKVGHEPPSGETVIKELGPLLSKGAAIVLPSSKEGEELQIRASSPRIKPGYVAVVEVASEKDVQETIKYANRRSTPFLAVSGAHGWPSSLNKVHGGIQINMRKLNTTTLSHDGKSATVGGGTMQYEITAALFNKGKQAVTGICECVSTIGPLLGGGHSMLQGRHGFASDNLISARAVLADGSVKSVSQTQHPDLFWALRGAGHNFGVVTSFQVRVFEVTEKWTMVALSFTQDKLEAFFETWNGLEKRIRDPGMVVLNGVMARNNDLDKNHPLINLQILYEGNPPAATEYATAFRKLSPVADSTTRDIPWGKLFEVGGFGLSSPVCRKNQNILGYPNSFDAWDPAAMRRGFEIYTEITADKTFATSAWLLESYGRKGVRDVPEKGSAVAPEERRFHLLTSPMLWWEGDGERDREKAELFGRRMQEAVRGEGRKHTYVNYAKGGEGMSEVYGYDAGRRARLRALKGMWDGENRFGFYNPIV